MRILLALFFGMVIIASYNHASLQHPQSPFPLTPLPELPTLEVPEWPEFLADEERTEHFLLDFPSSPLPALHSPALSSHDCPTAYATALISDHPNSTMNSELIGIF